MLEPLVLLLLVGVGAAAEFVDAVAGGGGLIGVPVLISVGLSPIAAFATNKAQSIVGTAIAVHTYWRGGFISLRAALPGMAAALIGSMVGVFAVKRVDISFLAVAVPVALILIAAYFLFAPRLTDASRHARLPFALFVPVMGFVLGFYDGAFGPGAGTFFTVGFVTLFGLGLTRAAGHTKALNIMSNVGALAMFIPAGDVVWPAAAAMAVGQLAGGYVGARTGIRFGARIIKPLVVAVAMILAVRLLFFPG